ncbi:MAG: C4-dicarboxylate ABC transporter [Acidobacteria bacterium]|nr:MAG: C4-dicarboxylate ABC transporter [Acidobacteriota bacterium]
MNVAVASLIALILAIVLSMTTRLNVGLAALVFAWLIGTFVAHLGADTIVRGFPSALFLTLTGMTLLFAAAETNGTLEGLAHRAVAVTRGRAALLPPMFFAIAFVISMIGPGAVSSVALVAPLTMAIGARAGVPPFLSALVVANGANAGNLSPVSAVGIIANTKMAEAGVGGHPGKVMFANFAASALVAVAAYVILGRQLMAADDPSRITVAPRVTFSGRQRFTIAVLVGWIFGVVVFRLHPGLSAFLAAVLLLGTSTAEEGRAIARVPWGAILMVTGVSTLVALLETTGGMTLFTDLLARLASPATLDGVIAFVTGAISLYSSTSGVVLPAFLPTVPGLVHKVGGGDPLAVALSINVGSSLVDVSPLSTIGALCIAAVSDGPEARVLFRQLLAWGIAMVVVGAIVCQVFAGLLARA